jgi:hypothetical protein
VSALTPRDAAAGASAFPVAVLLALVEPALGLIAGFAVFLAVQRVPLRLPRLRLRTPRPVLRRPRALRLGR